MKTDSEPLTWAEQEQEIVQMVLRLYTSVRHLQSAQSNLITLLRRTNEKRLVSQASALSEACADELEAMREELDVFRAAAKPV